MWFYYSPTIIFGEDALDHLENIGEDLEKKKVFIVTDPGIIKVKLVDILTDKLKELGFEFKIFDKVEPDPREETIGKGAEICCKYEPDLIIGLGGGSSIDAAKAIFVLYERPDLSIDDIHPFLKLNLRKKTMFVAIPTTAGTGAETTWVVMVTRIQDGINMKLEQSNREVIPDVAILDPRFCKTLPPKLTAITGLDAVGHAIEAVIALWKNDYSFTLSLGAYDLIRNYLPRAYSNGNDMEAREKMQNAAAMAGISFGNSQVILNHSLAHTFGATFHIPHAVGVGVFLPYVMQFSMKDPEIEQLLGKFSKMLGISNWTDTNTVASKKLVEDLQKLQDKVNFPRSLKEVLDGMGISKEQLDEKMELLIQQIYESAVSSMSPRMPTKEEYVKIITYAYEGKNIDF